MNKVLLGLGLWALAVVGAQAETLSASSASATSTSSASGGQNRQVLVCNEKISVLTNQLSPLYQKRLGLWSERKTIGVSGGELANYKLSQLDQQIAVIQKEIDGVNGQIDTEKKRCDDLASAKLPNVLTPTPSPPPAPAIDRSKHKPRRP